MRNRDLDRMLREAHAAPPRPDDPDRDGLRARLVAEHRRAHPRNQRWKIMTHRIWFRPAVAMVAIAALGVAACTTPTEYEVPMGQQLSLAFSGAAKDGAASLVEEVAAWVETRPGVEGVMVGLEERADGPLTGHLTVWGQDLDGERLQADLASRFGDLAGAEVTVKALEGTVEGNLAAAMGHAVFGLEVSGETAEEVRAGILAQLAAQGFGGEAQVEVIDADGQRTVNIELNDVQTGDAAGAGEVIIELKKTD